MFEQSSPTLGRPVRMAQGQSALAPMPLSPVQSSGTPPVPAGTGSTPEHSSMMQCVAGGIALLGLIILPLVLK